jgi:hypothetical protein
MHIPILSTLLGQIYLLGSRLNRSLTRSIRLPKPVISVGNIASGGRGKTPFVVFMTQKLKEFGFEPVILSRGYGKRQSKTPVWLVPGSKKNFEEDMCGDEALEMFYKTRSPVLVGPRRFQNALLFLRGLDPSRKIIFILDDGFQHWELHRDFDLVLVRKDDFNDDLLPLGRLREPVESLGRADLVLELGKDFSKKTFFKKTPPLDKPLLVLTTRAKDPDYKRYFTEKFKNPFFLELRDHASFQEVIKALKPFTTDTSICIGAKEATKIFSYSELSTFFEEGYSKKLLFDRNPHEFFFADFELWMNDSQILWQRLRAKISNLNSLPQGVH